MDNLKHTWHHFVPMMHKSVFLLWFTLKVAQVKEVRKYFHSHSVTHITKIRDGIVSHAP